MQYEVLEMVEITSHHLHSSYESGDSNFSKICCTFLHICTSYTDKIKQNDHQRQHEWAGMVYRDGAGCWSWSLLPSAGSIGRLLTTDRQTYTVLLALHTHKHTCRWVLTKAGRLMSSCLLIHWLVELQSNSIRISMSLKPAKSRDKSNQQRLR